MTTNNTILFIGLNPDATNEVQSLRSHGNKVDFIGNSKKADQVLIAGKVYDLSTEDGRNALLGAMTLSSLQQDIVTKVITDAEANDRDELGKLALRWAAFEKTDVYPSRMVVSAHHAGGSFYWGDKNGGIALKQVKSLASVFPKAAGSIYHLHFSACYSARSMMDWSGAFRNLQTLWGYKGSAPGSASGATVHLRIWDTQTRRNPQRLNRDAAKRTRKGENVAVWSRTFGKEEGVVMDIATLRANEVAGRTTYQDFFAGNQIVAQTDSGPLRDYYNTVQALLNHSDLQAAERPALETKRDTTIRLIFYQKEIRKKFQSTHAAAITAGYQAVGLPVPNFATLDRKQALGVIQDFKAKVGSSAPAAATTCRRLVEGLRDLDPRIIPTTWI